MQEDATGTVMRAICWEWGREAKCGRYISDWLELPCWPSIQILKSDMPPWYPSLILMLAGDLMRIFLWTKFQVRGPSLKISTDGVYGYLKDILTFKICDTKLHTDQRVHRFSPETGVFWICLLPFGANYTWSKFLSPLLTKPNILIYHNISDQEFHPIPFGSVWFNFRPYRNWAPQ